MEITKKHKRILVIGSLVLLLLCAFLYLFVNWFGPSINDAAALKRVNTIETISLPDDIESAEYTRRVGRLENDERLLIWVGVAVRTDLPLDELIAKVETIAGFENAEIMPYDNALAGELGFSGIQKELVDRESTNGYYLIRLTSKAATTLDKRNR